MDSTKLAEKLEELIEQAHDLVGNLPAIEPVLEQIRGVSVEIDKLITEKKDLLSGKTPPVVAFVGDFNAGKSSIINRLFEEDICPVNACPTTSSVTRFEYGAKETIEYQSEETPLKEITRDEYKRLVTHSDNQEIVKYKFRYKIPIPLLKDVTIIDTPGFENLKNPYDTKITQKVMETADALFYIIDVNQPEITGSAMEILKQIKSNEDGFAIYLFANKADMKYPPKRLEIHESLKKKYGKLFRKCLLFSVKPQESSEHIATIDEVLTLFNELRKNKSLLTGGRIRLEEQRLARETNDILLKLKRVIQRKINEEPESKDLLNVYQGVISKQITKFEDIVTNEIVKLDYSIRKRCLSAVEIPDSGIIWDDAKIVLDKEKAKELWQQSEIIRRLTEKFSSLLSRLQILDNGVVNKFQSDLQKKWNELGDAFVRRLGYRVDYRNRESFFDIDEAEDALDSFFLDGYEKSYGALSFYYIEPLTDLIWERIKERVKSKVKEDEKDRNKLLSLIQTIDNILKEEDYEKS